MTVRAFVIALVLFMSASTAGGVYWLEQRVRSLEAERERLHGQIADERRELHNLRAEWNMRNQPERLAWLAQHHAARFGLQPAEPNQIRAVDALPPRALLQAEQAPIEITLPDGGVGLLQAKPRLAAYQAARLAEVLN
ncbi:MAG: hypothetical protein ACFB3T_14980 [Geminicoccaceae bacterium]